LEILVDTEKDNFFLNICVTKFNLKKLMHLGICSVICEISVVQQQKFFTRSTAAATATMERHWGYMKNTLRVW
jgi:hypothetical protein